MCTDIPEAVSQLSREVSRSWPLLGLGGVTSGSTNYSPVQYCTVPRVLVGAWIYCHLATEAEVEQNTDSAEHRWKGTGIIIMGLELAS